MRSDEPEDRAARFTWEPGDLELIHMPFEQIFRSEANAARDRFLSRLFGLFNEWVVRDWCAGPEAPFDDLGRPTLFDLDERRGYTLDFALQRRGSSAIYVSEMKCELEYESYRYLRLTDPAQLLHHKSPAFNRFRELSRDPARYLVKLGGKPIEVAGTILVWGAITPEGRDATIAEYGLADVLSIEDMLMKLRQWGDATPWPGRVKDYRDWANELFDALTLRSL